MMPTLSRCTVSCWVGDKMACAPNLANLTRHAARCELNPPPHSPPLPPRSGRDAEVDREEGIGQDLCPSIVTSAD